MRSAVTILATYVPVETGMLPPNSTSQKQTACCAWLPKGTGATQRRRSAPALIGERLNSHAQATPPAISPQRSCCPNAT